MKRVTQKDEVFAEWARRAFQEGDWISCVENVQKSGRFREELAQIEAAASFNAARDLCAQAEPLKALSHLKQANSLRDHLSPRDNRMVVERLALAKRGSLPIADEMCPTCRDDKVVAPARFLEGGSYQPEIEAITCIAAYRHGYDRKRANKFSQAIRLGKRDQRTCQMLGGLLAHWLLRHCERAFHSNMDFILPIPTSFDRFAARRYSIAEEIGLGVSEVLCLPLVATALAMTRETQDLRYLGRAERILELDGAFAVQEMELIEGAHVLLVDDVTTSGATLREASRVIRNAGAIQINAAVLAHTESSWWR